MTANAKVSGRCSHRSGSYCQRGTYICTTTKTPTATYTIESKIIEFTCCSGKCSGYSFTCSCCIKNECTGSCGKGRIIGIISTYRDCFTCSQQCTIRNGHVTHYRKVCTGCKSEITTVKIQ